jgi:4-hydroxy-tetrahydrodipicolinate reductase
MKLALIGRGKMGTAISALAVEKGWEVTCLCGSTEPLKREAIERADVVIEFTRPEAAVRNAEQVLSWKKDMVVGTTGWTERLEHVTRLVEQAGSGFLYGANFSIGMNLLYQLCGRAGELFAGHDFAPFIWEAHHGAKRDAPSGTARELQERLRGHLGVPVSIGSLRAGHFPGTHTIGFDSRFETVTLTHEVRDRRVFAEGALAAAQWIHGRKGVFTFPQMFEERVG